MSDVSVPAVVSFLKDVVSTLAILVAGVWTYFLYVRKRVGAWNLVLTIDTSSTPYDQATALLTCRITLKNAGSVRIIPGPHGLQISIRQVPSGLARGALVGWDDSYPTIVKEHDLLSVYLNYFRKNHEPGKSDYEGVYSLEPAAEYHEQIGAIVERGFNYLVEVTFWWRRDADSMTEYATAHVE